jgi:hypothetical protein
VLLRVAYVGEFLYLRVSAGNHSAFGRNIKNAKYLLIYFPTPWSRVLVEKLTDLQLVKKFSAFHGTRRFIAALTSARHLSLS